MLPGHVRCGKQLALALSPLAHDQENTSCPAQLEFRARGWAKSRVLGSQLQMIESIHLRNRSWHDLALLGTALDTMLRASDLLKLKVSDVMYPSGKFRSEIRCRQQKTKRNVYPVLNEATKNYLTIWIRLSGKKQHHYLFTRTKGRDSEPISRGQYARLTKRWADWLELPPEEFSTHSLRRSRAVIMFEKGEPIELISKLLGHKSAEVTTQYLGIDQKKAAAASLRHPVLKGPTKEILLQI